MTGIAHIAEQAKAFVDTKRYLDAIPQLDPDDPWSSDSLTRAEGWFLARRDALTDAQKTNYLYFLGEGLRRRFGGTWVTAAAMGNTVPELEDLFGIRYSDEHMDVVSTMLDTAIAVDTGDSWAAFFEITDEYLNSDLADNN